MSDFANAVEKEERAGYLGRGCGVGVLLAKLAPKLRAEVTAVLKERDDLSTAGIRRALLNTLGEKHAGDPKMPSEYTWVRHRKGKCNCE